MSGVISSSLRTGESASSLDSSALKATIAKSVGRTALIAAAILSISLPVSAKVVREDFPKIEGAPAVHLYQWRDPALKPKAVALAVHGLIMHGATYDSLARELASRGVIVVALDLRGYGRWYKDAPDKGKMMVQVALGKRHKSARQKQQEEEFSAEIFQGLHGGSSVPPTIEPTAESKGIEIGLDSDLITDTDPVHKANETTLLDASSALNLIGPKTEIPSMPGASDLHGQRTVHETSLQASSLQDPAIHYGQSYKELVQLSSALRNKYPSLPLYCIGESLGAALALHLASDMPDSIDGLILSSPAVKRKLFYFAPALVKDVVSVLSRPFPLFTQVDVSPYIRRWASEDPKTCNATVEDPLVRKRLSTYDLLLTMKEVRGSTRYANKIPAEMPVLIIQGDKDRMVRANGVVTLMSHLKSTDETVKWFVGKGHLLLETPYVMPETVETVSGWLLQHASDAKQLRAEGNDPEVSI